MSTAIGSGVLSLPYVNFQSGLLVGSILLIVGAVVAYWSMV